jgi:phosphotransferase system HPr (HPr) family protein
MRSSQIVVMDPVGLHARPAALFVKLANKFTADIFICNLTASDQWLNAKSILSLLACGVRQGDQIGIKAEGADEVVAIEALEELVRSEFTKNVD